MAFDLSSVLGGVGNILPSQNELVNNIVLGAVTSVVLSGLKSQSGQDALDPLHLFHKDGTSTIVGKTISAAAFASLPPASQAMLMAQGYSIV